MCRHIYIWFVLTPTSVCVPPHPDSACCTPGLWRKQIANLLKPESRSHTQSILIICHDIKNIRSQNHWVLLHPSMNWRFKWKGWFAAHTYKKWIWQITKALVVRCMAHWAVVGILIKIHARENVYCPPHQIDSTVVKTPRTIWPQLGIDMLREGLAALS